MDPPFWPGLASMSPLSAMRGQVGAGQDGWSNSAREGMSYGGGSLETSVPAGSRGTRMQDWPACAHYPFLFELCPATLGGALEMRPCWVAPGAIESSGATRGRE